MFTNCFWLILICCWFCNAIPTVSALFGKAFLSFKKTRTTTKPPSSSSSIPHSPHVRVASSFLSRPPQQQHPQLLALRAGTIVPSLEADDSTTTTTTTTTEKVSDDARQGSSPLPLLVDYAGEEPPTRALVLMDCFCPYLGLYVAERVKSDWSGGNRDSVGGGGVAVVYVLSDYLRIYSQLTEPDQMERWEAAKIPNVHEVEAWKARLGGGDGSSSSSSIDSVEWVGVYAESDSGLEDAEKLRKLLNVTCQDDPVILPSRRNKFLMNERVGNAGLTVAKQKLCTSQEEAVAFARELLLLDTPPPTAPLAAGRVVVKPFRGCGTESVYLCDTLEEVMEAWTGITSTKVFATQEMHTTVLIQEFLAGVEYAVDVVARDGHYKVAAIWRYDKRPANGAPFCYFRTQLVDSDVDDNVSAIVDYVFASLRALGIRWGISHNEVILTADRGPILVEVNCRQHNMDFCPIAMACIGYNALDMLVESFLGQEVEWQQYPDLPSLVASGCMVHLVNYASGKLAGVHHLEYISQLPSVLELEVYPDFMTPGTAIAPTIDIRSDAGWVQLVNDDPEELEKDYTTIVGLMPTMFEVEESPSV